MCWHFRCRIQSQNCLIDRDCGCLLSSCFTSEGTPLPLVFQEPAATASKLYGGLESADLKHKLATENLTENSHHDGISPSTFVTNAALSGFYTVLSTNVDTTGAPFVSTMEAKEYPIYGVQVITYCHSAHWLFALCSTLDSPQHSAACSAPDI